MRKVILKINPFSINSMDDIKRLKGIDEQWHTLKHILKAKSRSYRCRQITFMISELNTRYTSFRADMIFEKNRFST